MKLWTCIATCSVCGKELRRTENIAEDRRTKVIMKAPFVAICDVPEHNTFGDFNLRLKLNWIEQEAQQLPTPKTPSRYHKRSTKRARHGARQPDPTLR